MTRRVLITRPLARSVSLAAALERLGFIPLCNPLLEITPTGAELPEPMHYSGIVLTSQSAIPFVPVIEAPVFTVGETTAASARQAGFTDVTCGGRDVAELASYLVKRKGETLLYPSGTEIAHDLKGLLPGGPAILRVPVYSATPLALQKTTIRHLYAGGVAWIVVASARTAETLQGELERLETLDWTRHTGLACLAPHIAETLAAYRWRQIETANQPTEAELLACLTKGRGRGDEER